MSDIIYDVYIAIEKYKPIFSKKYKPILKRWFARVGVVCFVIFIIFWSYKSIEYQKFEDENPPEKKQAEMEIEFKKIAPPQNVSISDYHSSTKGMSALVSAGYSTSLSFNDIFKYYDEQLRQHGWKYQNIFRDTVWGEDIGGKSVIYCKGDYEAHLQYAGEQVQYDWTYTFSLKWGLNNCK